MIPERYSSIVYALFRIVVGFLFFCHGPQTLFGLFGGIDGKGTAMPLGSLGGVAGTLELVCGLLVLCGLFARVAAFLASGEMAVAYFMAHQPNGLLPIQNQGELAVLYCFSFLYIAAQGPGVWRSTALCVRQKANRRT
jgi:putative oxidoreductase